MAVPEDQAQLIAIAIGAGPSVVAWIFYIRALFAGRDERAKVAAMFASNQVPDGTLVFIGGRGWFRHSGELFRQGSPAHSLTRTAPDFNTSLQSRRSVEHIFQWVRPLLLAVLTLASFHLFRICVLMSLNGAQPAENYGYGALFLLLGGLLVWVQFHTADWEKKYRHGDQDVPGAMVLDAISFRPGDSVSSQKVHGDARLANMAEALEAGAKNQRTGSIHDQEF